MVTGAYLRLVTNRLSAVSPAAAVRALPGQGHGALATAPHLVAASVADLAGDERFRRRQRDPGADR